MRGLHRYRVPYHVGRFPWNLPSAEKREPLHFQQDAIAALSFARQGACLITLRPADLLIFGAAKAGTPLMQLVSTVGIDLPLKALVWPDLIVRMERLQESVE